VVKQIWTLCWKELRLWSQKVDHWVVVFVVPLVFIGIIGASFSEGGTPTVAVYAVNEDEGEWGKKVMSALRDSKNLEIEVLEDRAEADRLIGAGRRMAALVVPAGFSDALFTDQGGRVEVIVDPARDEKAKIAKGLAQAALIRFIVNAEVSRAMRQALDNIVQDVDAETIEPDERNMLIEFMSAGFEAVISKQVLKAIDDPQVKVEMVSAVGETTEAVPTAFVYVVPGFSVIFCFFLVKDVAVMVVDEREAGTLSRLLAAPITRGGILIGKALPLFGLAFVQLVSIFVLASAVFDLELGNWGAMLLVLLSTAAVVAGLGIAIAAIVRTEGQAGGLTIVLILALAAVGGAMGEGSAIPVLKNVSPHYWSIMGIQNVMARGMGLEGVWLPCTVLLALMVVLSVIGVLRFKFD
jgi:ABC-2 type transport system permease protein